MQGSQPSRTRLPITPEILSQINQHWKGRQVEWDVTMIWAAMLLCFYGFLRTGEVVVPSNTEFDPSQHLTYDDIAVDKIRDPSFVTVRIKQSKTDPFRKGVTVVIGRAARPLCPLAAILSYMARRKPGKGSLFWFEDGRPLTRDHFVMKVREALQQIQKLCRTQLQNWSCNYCGEERDTGLTNTLGRWESVAYQLFVRTPREQLITVAATLAG